MTTCREAVFHDFSEIRRLFGAILVLHVDVFNDPLGELELELGTVEDDLVHSALGHEPEDTDGLGLAKTMDPRLGNPR